VVVGGGDVGCETACHLADNGWDVTLVEIQPKLMEENIMTNVKVQMFALLKEKNIKIMTETKLNAVTDEGAEIILPNGKQWGLEAGSRGDRDRMKKPETFAPGGASMHLTPLSGDTGKLASIPDEVHVIGDCAILGRIREAVEAGERVGRWL